MAQLRMEYNPMPPFDAGSPFKAPKEEVLEVMNTAKTRQEKRYAATLAASKELDNNSGTDNNIA
jgi:hypothetical protein